VEKHQNVLVLKKEIAISIKRRGSSQLLRNSAKLGVNSSWNQCMGVFPSPSNHSNHQVSDSFLFSEVWSDE
jgi:hypothetical protein